LHTTKPVLVRVGKDEEQADYLLPENTLRKSSDLINERLDEIHVKKQRTIDLPETPPTIFSIYCGWLRTGRLYTRTKDEEDELDLLGEACILGHNLRDTDLVDAVYDAVFQYSTEDHTDLLDNLIEYGTLLYTEVQSDIPIRNPVRGACGLARS
jgi:hypothetical protein